MTIVWNLSNKAVFLRSKCVCHIQLKPPFIHGYKRFSPQQYFLYASPRSRYPYPDLVPSLGAQHVFSLLFPLPRSKAPQSSLPFMLFSRSQYPRFFRKSRRTISRFFIYAFLSYLKIVPQSLPRHLALQVTKLFLLLSFHPFVSDYNQKNFSAPALQLYSEKASASQQSH